MHVFLASPYAMCCPHNSSPCIHPVVLLLTHLVEAIYRMDSLYGDEKKV
jgi:hypothetical protein